MALMILNEKRKHVHTNDTELIVLAIHELEHQKVISFTPLHYYSGRK